MPLLSSFLLVAIVCPLASFGERLNVQGFGEEDVHHYSVKDGERRPNIILFFVDDLGYGDLTPYGHPTSNTPHIQKLAEEGLLFTQFYTSSPVCSPSRAAVLTGRYQTRSGIYPGVFQPNDLGGLPHNETTIAEGLKEIGYNTGMIGKWHLGVGANGSYLPNHHGFDYYMGIPYTHDACPCHLCFYPKQACHIGCNPQFVPCPVYECKDGQQEIVQQPADLTTLSANLAMSAVSFVQKQAANGDPFFLYYAFQHMHSPQFAGQKFRNSSVRGSYGDSLREVNWAVGQVLQALTNAGIDDNTLIFLTADNGPDLSQGVRGGSAGPLRCGKASTWEGGMRVPAIAWWPNVIRHGRTHQLAATLDILPTIYSIVGAELPEDVRLDGVDLSSLLFNRAGKSKRTWFAYFPEYADQSQGPFAVRWKAYKAHYYTQGGLCSNEYPDVMCRQNTSLVYHSPPLLYNLNSDPGELYPLDSSSYRKVLENIEMVRQQLLYDLEWGTSQLLVGQDDSVQPCGDPGCEPFPYCCRSNLLQNEQTLAWL